MKVQGQGIDGVFLERAAAEELASKLTDDGWAIEREADVDGNRVDLVARRDGEAVFYEFKLAGTASPDAWSKELVAQQQSARRHGARFRLILVRPPRQMELEIEEIEQMLFLALSESPPWQVADIAGHTMVDDVSGVDLTSIRIRGVLAQVEGEASLGVTLQTGGGEHVSSETFPFSFSATLDLAAGLAGEVEVHDVDTTSWYGAEEDEDDDGDPRKQDGPDHDPEDF